MNILILGGLGFLGRNLTKSLAENHNVFIVDCVDYNGKNYYKTKISDTEELINIIENNKIEVVMHLISSILPSSSIDQYLTDINDIYNPSIKLIDYCATNKIKFVYFSSGGAIYGNQKEIFSENTKREPVSFYGLSKLNYENSIAFYHNTKKLEYLIIRPSNPYGYGQNIYGKQGIIAVIIGKIIKNEPIQIWGDGSVVKDYIYIDDFTFYVAALIESNHTWNHIYNIGSGIGYSINDVLNTFKQNGIELPAIEYINENASDVKRMILDCTKIHDMFDYKQTSLNDGIKKFWEKETKK